MNKKELSKLIIVLIILIIIVSSLILIILFKTKSQKEKQITIEQSKVDLEIVNGSVLITDNGISLKVHRSAGNGKLTKIKFTLLDEKGKSISIKLPAFDLKEFETKTFSVKRKITSKAISISIQAIIKEENKKEAITPIMNKYFIKGDEPIIEECISNNLCAYDICSNETCINDCGEIVEGKKIDGDCGKNIDCISNNSCQLDTCLRETCQDDCNNIYDGIKTDGDCENITCIPDYSCQLNICSNETCSDECNGIVNGTKTDGDCGNVVLPPPVLYEQDPFGLHAVTSKIDEVNNLGVRWVRKAGFKWETVEPKKGIYDYSKLDDVVKVVAKMNNSNLIITLRAINSWGGKTGLSNPGFSGFPTDIEAWKITLRNVVERYDGDGFEDMPGLINPIKYWQIEGEWMWMWEDTKENYVDFLNISYQIIKASDKNAKVISSGLTAVHLFVLGDELIPNQIYTDNFVYNGDLKVPQKAYIENLTDVRYQKSKSKAIYLLSSGKDYFDIMDMHSYTSDYKILPAQIKWVKNEMKKNGYDKPLWSLENAGPFYNLSYSCFDCVQSNEVVKRYVISLKHGIDKLFWSSLVTTIGWSDNFQRLSLIDSSNIKKPAYYTYKIMVEKLNHSDFKNINNISESGGTFIYEFNKSQSNIFVLWSDIGNKTIDLSPYLSTQKVKVTHIVTNLDGNNNPVYSSDEVLLANSILITDTPIFVEAN